jgi:hypothetical protein
MPKLEISKVHDAYVQPGECPLCALHRGAEEIYLRSFTHSRVMEPNVRVQTNESGFCPDHYRKLYAQENKLGLALVVHTHLVKQAPALLAGFDAAVQAGKRGRSGGDTAAAMARRLRDACFLCELLRQDRDRYCFTILYLWNKDPEFLPVFRASRGFCLPHYADICDAAEGNLRPERRQRWMAECAALMSESIRRLEKEVLAFTQLHRDTNRGLGSEEERTALSRTLQKLAGGEFRLS